MRFLILLFVVIMLIYVYQLLEKEELSFTLPQGYKNSSWSWDILKAEGERWIEAIEFANKRNVKVLHVLTEEYVDLESEKKAEFEAKLIEFISLAQSYGIKIEALGGDVNWAESDYKYIPHKLMDLVLEFNKKYPQSKFAGIHYDVEFYNHKDFKKNKTLFTKNYLELVKTLKGKLENNADNNFRLGFAIPYGLSGSKRTPEVEFDGKKASTLDHILDILKDTDSYLAIMAYRTHAKGKNGSIEISKNDLDTIEASGGKTKSYIGIETTKNEVKSITFYNQTKNIVNKTAGEIVKEFGKYKSFGGIVVHTLEGYKELK